MPRDSLWDTLPQHLMELIIEKLDEPRSRKSKARMRLVSKSWLAAVTAYPGTLKCKSVKQQDELLRLCQLLPNMTGLDLSSKMRKLSLQPLSIASQLSHLSLTGNAKDLVELDTDISALPKSLRELHIKSICLAPDGFRSLQCVNLTSLSLCSGKSRAGEVWELLQHLPKLKVRSLYFWVCLK